MKFLKLIILLIFLNPFYGNAQEKDVLPIPQFKAEPNEGMQKFYAAFVRNFNSSTVKLGQEYAKSKLFFFVETDGTFSDITAEGEMIEVNEEVIRVMKLMPIWKPATTNGDPVRSKFIMPISIRVTKDNLSKK